MAELGIDIAWARPTVAQIEATGARWVARYLSTDSSKNLTAAETRAYSAAGLGTVVVWETTTGRATQGFAAGVSDARAAVAQRAADGLPASEPIHFAVDEDTSWSSVAPYFAGAASVVGKALVGVYGGYAVIEGAHAAGYTYLWQTVAWSGGRWSAHATIRQTGGTVLSGGADVDYAQTEDFGEYPRPTTTPPVPPTPPEDDMPYTEAQIVEFARQGALAAIQSQPGRDALAYADLWWLEHALAGTSTPGMSAAQKALVASIHADVVKLAQLPAPVAVTPPAK